MLSAVVTCYQDEPALEQMHARLTQVMSSLGVDYEIIFVNDASPDDADRVLADLTSRDAHVIAIEHSRNFGSQNAFLSGMQIARGDAVILLDGDLQDPPELIGSFFHKWREGFDVVYGCRGKREGSRVLELCARAFYRIFRGTSDVSMPLDAGDFSLMDRKVVDALLALPETDQFLRGLRTWVGFMQTGIDYVRPARPFGTSTHSFLKNIWWARKALFSFTTVPIELLSYAAVLMTGTSFLALVYEGFCLLRDPGSAHGVGLLASLVAFFGSLNLLAVAVIGEYLIKIFEETKKRPHFIRKAIRFRGQHLRDEAQMRPFLNERGQRSDNGAQPQQPIKVGDGAN
jgi:dolichol-phosphate mannosyltransferase